MSEQNQAPLMPRRVTIVIVLEEDGPERMVGPGEWGIRLGELPRLPKADGHPCPLIPLRVISVSKGSTL